MAGEVLTQGIANCITLRVHPAVEILNLSGIVEEFSEDRNNGSWVAFRADTTIVITNSREGDLRYNQ